MDKENLIKSYDHLSNIEHGAWSEEAKERVKQAHQAGLTVSEMFGDKLKELYKKNIKPGVKALTNEGSKAVGKAVNNAAKIISSHINANGQKVNIAKATNGAKNAFTKQSEAIRAKVKAAYAAYDKANPGKKHTPNNKPKRQSETLMTPKKDKEKSKSKGKGSSGKGKASAANKAAKIAKAAKEKAEREAKKNEEAKKRNALKTAKEVELRNKKAEKEAEAKKKAVEREEASKARALQKVTAKSNTSELRDTKQKLKDALTKLNKQQKELGNSDNNSSNITSGQNGDKEDYYGRTNSAKTNTRAISNKIKKVKRKR